MEQGALWVLQGKRGIDRLCVHTHMCMCLSLPKDAAVFACVLLSSRCHCCC
jgi:hypothetical protein